MKRVLCLLLFLAAGSIAVSPSAGSERSAQGGPTIGVPHAEGWQKRWVYLASNLYADENIPKIESILQRASKAGYNGILFADVKTLTWWTLERPDRWKANAARLRSMATDLGLELVVCVFPFGYAEGMLAHDPNLAAGMPVKGAPLIRWADRLIPEQTAVIRNGSFEDYNGDRVAGYSLQDNPGKASFIDSQVRRNGRVSLRFQNVGVANRHGHGRVFQRIAVRPWQQYRIRVWMKADRLTADLVQIIALAGKRPLQYQSLTVPAGKEVQYLSSARDLTTDWVEQAVTFNSLDNANVTIGVGVWGGRTGTVWWDGLRIEAVPTLNVLRRDALPLAVIGEDGTAYREGADFNRIADPRMGMSLWAGTYDTRHDPAPVTVPAGTRIKEGERVELSCYHTAILYGDQVCCSLDDPAAFELCAEEIRKVNESLGPDGYFMSHDEIRCAGWEPSQVKNFRTSGELFAYNIRKCYDIAAREGGGKPIYVWSDMYDPGHNAHANFFLVNNTIAGSWKGLDPRVIVMKWGSAGEAAQSLRFFADRGNKTMIAAYYDGDVEEDHALWTKAAEGAPGVIGVMYTTWERDYSDLERFAELWWGAR